jgi:hypothetical protein
MGSLDAELVDASGRVADVALEPVEDVRVEGVAGVGEKFALGQFFYELVVAVFYV